MIHAPKLHCRHFCRCYAFSRKKIVLIKISVNISPGSHLNKSILLKAEQKPSHYLNQRCYMTHIGVTWFAVRCNIKKGHIVLTVQQRPTRREDKRSSTMKIYLHARQYICIEYGQVVTSMIPPQSLTVISYIAYVYMTDLDRKRRR